MFMVATATYGRQGRPVQRIHAAKIAYMTDRLQLTEEQAAKFVPVYKEYEKDLLATRSPYMKKYHLQKADDNSDLSSRQYVEDDLDYQQEVIELKRKYNDRFLKVISSVQLSQMYASEREFRQILMRRLRQREGRGGRR
jgi:hypothetical protein